VAATTAARKRKKVRPLWVRRTKQVLAVLTLLLLIGISIGSFMFVQELKAASEAMGSLPDLMARVVTQPSVVVSADGKVLYRVSTEFRKPVKYTQVPAHVRDAIVAAEDKRFFEHKGVDYIGLARGVFTNVRERRLAQGGSTLTMQLAKLLFTSPEKTFQRKIRDMAMAITMERELTKEQILELYMNKVYFGKGAWGVQAAANVYFNKSVDKLSIAEGALLARCVREPSRENPFNNLETSIRNRDVVLGIMRDENMIKEAEYESAIKEAPKLNKHAPETSARLAGAPYFVQHVLATVAKEHPDIQLEEGGYRIETTLNFELQKVAEKEVARVVREHRRDKVTNAAFLLMDREGKILAEVGGVDFNRDQFNVVTQGKRQPGSAFKPFVYASALSTGAISIDEYISNARYTYVDPSSGESWTPDNSHNSYGGMVSVRTAFAQSLNIPAARVMEKTGPSTVVALGESAFGFTPGTLKPFMSLALGASDVSPLDMARGYSVFMTGGSRVEPYTITRIVGPDGETIPSEGQRILNNVFDANVCAQMDELMRAVVTSGTGRKALVVPNSRGKTGTTSDNKDAWFCGYSDGLVGIGWIGNVQYVGKRPSYLPMARRVFGGTVPIEFWASVMKLAHEKFATEVEMPKPDNSDEDVAKNNDEKPLEDSPVPDLDEPKPRGDAPGPVKPGEGTIPPGQVSPPVDDPGTTAIPPSTTGGGPPVRNTDPPPDDPPTSDDTHEVEVCADTGMRASIYCPETVTRRFKRGREPRRRCTKHTGGV
jgi:penicillin-binding protein 1A